MRELADAERIRRLFEEIEPALFRYPALDPASFRRRVFETVGRSA